MADRDALIVICWLIILILVFFECFHRKLKARFGGDIRPPANTRQSLTSFPLDAVAVGGSSSISESRFGGSFRPSSLLPLSLGNTMSFSRGIRFTGPVAITTSAAALDTNLCGGGGSSKEACRIPMMYEDAVEEEPPPTYEEAISYAKLMSKFQSMPYGDKSGILQCDDNSVNAGTSAHSSDGNRSTGDVSSTTPSNSSVVDMPVMSTTPRTTTTAIFVNEEESDHEEDEGDDDGSSSNESGSQFDEDGQGSADIDSNNNSGNVPLVRDASESCSSNVISKTNNIINAHEERSGEVQCSVNVILTSSASTSKNLDRFGTEYSEKLKFTGGSTREKKKFPFETPPPPPKPFPPICHFLEM